MTDLREVYDQMLFFPGMSFKEGGIDVGMYLGIERDIRQVAEGMSQISSHDEQVQKLLGTLTQVGAELNDYDRQLIVDHFRTFKKSAKELTQPLIDLVKTDQEQHKLVVGLERDGQLLRMMVDVVVSDLGVENVTTAPFFASRSLFERTLANSSNPEQALSRLVGYCRPMLKALENGDWVEIVDTGFNATVVVQLEEFLLLVRSQKLLEKLLRQSLQKIREKGYRYVIVSGTHPQYLAHRLEALAQKNNLELTIQIDTTGRSYVGGSDKAEASHGAGLIAKSMRDKHLAQDIPGRVLIVDTNSRYQTRTSDWAEVFDDLSVKAEFELIKIVAPDRLPRLHSSMVLSYPSRVHTLLEREGRQTFEVMSYLELATHLIEAVDEFDVYNQPHLVLRAIAKESEFTKLFCLFVAARVGLLVGTMEELKSRKQNVGTVLRAGESF